MVHAGTRRENKEPQNNAHESQNLQPETAEGKVVVATQEQLDKRSAEMKELKLASARDQATLKALTEQDATRRKMDEKLQKKAAEAETMEEVSTPVDEKLQKKTAEAETMEKEESEKNAPRLEEEMEVPPEDPKPETVDSTLIKAQEEVESEHSSSSTNDKDPALINQLEHGKEIEFDVSGNQNQDFATRHTNKLVFFITSFMFGCCGVDRCYMGQTALGIVKGLTLGGCSIWYFVDFIVVLANSWGKKRSIDALGFNAEFDKDGIQPAHMFAMAVTIWWGICICCMCCGGIWYGRKDQSGQ